MKQALNIPKHLVAPWLLRATCAAVEGLMFLCYSAVIIIYTLGSMAKLVRWSVQSVLRFVRPIICTVSSQDESHSHSSSRSGGKANHQSRSHHWLCHYRQDSITMVLLPIIVRTVLSWFFFPLSSGQYYHGSSSHYRQDSITMVLLPIIVRTVLPWFFFPLSSLISLILSSF